MKFWSLVVSILPLSVISFEPRNPKTMEMLIEEQGRILLFHSSQLTGKCRKYGGGDDM